MVSINKLMHFFTIFWFEKVFFSSNLCKYAKYLVENTLQVVLSVA